MNAPPDRGAIATEERDPRGAGLHRRDVADLVQTMNGSLREVLLAVEAAAPAITAFIEAIEGDFRAGGRLIYCGAGTSGRLGVLDASEMPPTFDTDPGRVVGLIAGGDRALRRSSEGREDDPQGAIHELQALQLTARDTVLGIAAGGTTPWVRGALDWCRRCSPSPHTALLSCAAVDPAPDVDHCLVVASGPEPITGSTRLKAGTATKQVLNTISTTLMVRSGRVYHDLMVDLRARNDKLLDRAARIVSALCAVDRGQALRLLAAADGHVPVAVIMQRFSCDAAAARHRLEQASLSEWLDGCGPT